MLIRVCDRCRKPGEVTAIEALARELCASCIEAVRSHIDATPARRKPTRAAWNQRWEQTVGIIREVGHIDALAFTRVSGCSRKEAQNYLAHMARRGRLVRIERSKYATTATLLRRAS